MSHIMRKPVFTLCEHIFIYANNKGTDQPAHPCSLISTFVVHCLLKYNTSLSLTWWQTPKTGYLVMWLILPESFYLFMQSAYIWTASSEFGTYRLCEQRRFRRACAFAQSRQNLCCSLIQAVSQEEPSDRKPDPWPLWVAGHAQLKLVMTECSKTQIRLTGLI